MTRHEDVYYTCNGCGGRLGGENSPFTVIEATNTDETAVDPVHEYDLCALCWLKILPIIDGVAIKAKAEEEERQDRLAKADADFRYRHPGFEG